MFTRRYAAFGMACVVALSACGGDSTSKPAETSTPSAAPQAAAASTSQTPDPGGKVITVTMTTDANGSRFDPAEVVASKGDVVRYTLKVGVHNVHFLPDSNAGKSGYPAGPSEMLQLPGQTFDVLVHFPAGTYYFQCDPHAALGMRGHVTVK